MQIRRPLGVPFLPETPVRVASAPAFGCLTMKCWGYRAMLLDSAAFCAVSRFSATPFFPFWFSLIRFINAGHSARAAEGEVCGMASEKRETFNSVIGDYAAARPGYPPELFADVVGFAGAAPGARVLEVGAGTGQATGYFAGNGYRVTALELGREQAGCLAAKYGAVPGFSAVCSPFEDFESPDGAWDLIVSATAFHWIRPEIGYPKAYRLLKKGGALAVWWHMSSVTRYRTEQFEGIRAIYRRLAPQLDTAKTEEELGAVYALRAEQFQTLGFFGRPLVREYRWTDVYTAGRYVRLLNSYTSFQVLGEETRGRVLTAVADYLERTGGTIGVPQAVKLYMGAKR